MMKRKKLNILLIFFILMIIWLIFGNRGIYNLWKLKKEKKIYLEKVIKLEEENRRLMQEIDRLKHDPEYIEAVIRREIKMVRDNELIVYFKDKDNEK